MAELHCVICDKVDLASLKPDVDKLRNVATGLDSLKSKVDKWSADKLVTIM